MVKHIILWQLKDEFSDTEKEEIKQNAKKALESLKGQVPGLDSICVNIRQLSSSNADMLLDCTLTDEESLHKYQIHPLHVKAAETYVRPFTKTRLCMDYII